MTTPLFILGAQKTGTSTLVGILNCHPEIFILYETHLNRSCITPFGKQLTSHVPAARKHFRNYDDMGEPYLALSQTLQRGYRYIGDKLIINNTYEIQNTLPHKIIYTVRDITTWLCKESIVGKYETDRDVVPAAIDYLKYLMAAHRHENCLIVRMEDLITNSITLIETISEFLSIDLPIYTRKWWNSIGKYREDDPKSFIEWHKGHPSSKRQPNILDTAILVKSHPFWDAYFPLFNKYYRTETRALDQEDDMIQLGKLSNYSPVPLEHLYQSISTQRFGIK